MSTNHTITICLGSSCFSRGNKETLDIVKQFIAEHHLEAEVFFHGELCTGNCENGPVLKINDKVYGPIKPDDVYDILTETFEV